MRRILTIAAIAAAASSQADTGYSLVDLGTLGGGFSNGFGLNASGSVVGMSVVAGGDYHGFLCVGSLRQDLGVLGVGPESYGFGINDSGQIAGWSDTSGYGTNHAIRYSGGVMTDLGTLGGPTSTGYAINASGDVAGQSEVNNHFHAFLYTGGSMLDLGTLAGNYSSAYAINDAGVVVGETDVSQGQLFVTHAFKWSNGVMTDLGGLNGGSYSSAEGINSLGQIVGVAQTPDHVNHAFLYSNGVMTDLGVGPFGTSCTAKAINNLGQVVGSYSNGTDTNLGFVWSGSSIQNLNDLVDETASGFKVTRANAINDGGLIAGSAENQLRQPHAILLIPFTTVNPSSFVFYHGSLVSGGLGSVASADGTYFVGRRGITMNAREAPLSIIFRSNLSSQRNQLRFTLRSHVSLAGLICALEMYDYVGQRWVLVQSFPAQTSDTTVTGFAPDSPRFVQAGTNEVATRVSWNPSGVVAGFSWTGSIDQAVWKVSP